MKRRSLLSGLAASAAAPVLPVSAAAPLTKYDALLNDPAELLELPPGAAVFQMKDPPDHVQESAASMFLQYIWDMSNGQNVEYWLGQFHSEDEIVAYRDEVRRYGHKAQSTVVRMNLAGFLYDNDSDHRVWNVMAHMREQPDPKTLPGRSCWGLVVELADDPEYMDQGLFSLGESGEITIATPEDGGRVAIWIRGVWIN